MHGELLNNYQNKADEKVKEWETILKFLNKIADSLEQGGVRTFLVNINDGQYTALIPFLKNGTEKTDQ